MQNNGLFQVRTGWEILSLAEVTRRSGGDIQTGPFGSQLHASDYVEYGIPSVMPKNIGENWIDDSDISKISEADARRLQKYRLKSGDIIYSRRGDVERRALVRSEQDGWLCGTGCLRIRFNDASVVPEYAAYYLGHPMVRGWIVQHAVGATMPNLNTSILGAVPFVVPPLGAQRDIAAILGALDDKIDLNRRMNETLEAMARAVFKSWFVDFDPVHAKAAGKAPAHMDAQTAALFPDAFGDDGLPVGWSLKRVDRFLELAYGKALKASERIDGPVPVYGSGGQTGWHNEALVQGPSVIVGRKGTVGSLYWEDGPFYPIDTTFYIKAESSLHFCFHMLDALKIDTMNTDAAVPGLNRNNVYRLTFPDPNHDLIRAFDRFSALLREKISSNNSENQTLAALRDLLLPKLMSGELRLRDAEAAVEAAL